MLRSVLLNYAIFFSEMAYGQNNNIYLEQTVEERRTKFLTDLITSNLRTNGWSNILCVGNLSDFFYTSMVDLRLTYSITTPGQNDYALNDIVPYSSNIVIIHCTDFDTFEQAFHKAMGSPYWHPHSHLILYYPVKEQKDVPNIFMIFWFYKACNAIIVQYVDEEESMLISYYSPFISENYRFSYEFGCWKSTKLGRPVRKFRDSFICVEGCHNITLHSKLKSIHLGTCIGFETHKVSYGERNALKKLNLFEDKGKNLHGFVMRGFAGEVLPFLAFEEHDDGSYTMSSRDGMLWNVTSQLMNFKIDLNASKVTLKKPFNFEVNIQQIYSFARREADIVLYPVYQFDLVIVEVDLSVPYRDSGVCILSHRAEYETVLFDAKLLQKNMDMVIRFFLCFNLIWFIFFIFNVVENGKISCDQAGKDFINAIRSILSISPHRPPKCESFRVYLFVSMWSFFVINFAAQAAIISFFSVHKRGKEVDTFEDMIEKGYNVEGMASPDMMLPDTEERFRKINSKLVPVPNLSDCVENMLNNSHRFCLIDCSVGRYFSRNRLDGNGEQYLHTAKDRIHGHYLSMIFHKHSPLTNTFNKHFMRYSEAGLVMKWEQYKFSDFKPIVPVKPLSLEDIIGIFKCYYLLLGLSSAIFILEIIIYIIKHAKKCYSSILKRIKNRTNKLKRIVKKRKVIDSSTQTL